MILTVQQILIESMSLIHTIAIDETPTSSELNTALISANLMLGGWSAHRLLLRGDTNVSFSTVAGTASYTIAASGAAITAAKPVKVLSAYLTDSGIDYPLEVVTTDFYDSLGDKSASSGRPIYVAYDAGVTQQTVQTGTLYFYNEPDKAYIVNLSCHGVITSFVNLSDTVIMEDIYLEALVYNLAVRLHRKFHSMAVPVPEDILVIARDSKSALMTINSSPVIAASDLAGGGGRYNVYTDQ